MKKKLFRFAILYHEQIREVGKPDEIKTQILVEPGVLLAVNETVAKVAAANRVPATHQDKLEDIEILVGNF